MSSLSRIVHSPSCSDRGLDVFRAPCALSGLQALGICCWRQDTEIDPNRIDNIDT